LSYFGLRLQCVDLLLFTHTAYALAVWGD